MLTLFRSHQVVHLDLEADVDLAVADPGLLSVVDLEVGWVEAGWVEAGWLEAAVDLEVLAV